eukprot:SAG31_NODE_338_length_17490_cov_7.707032_15_plen_544_part_00
MRHTSSSASSKVNVPKTLLLLQCEHFLNHGAADLRRLAEEVDVNVYGDGDPIVLEGAPGNGIFVIADGGAVAVRDGEVVMRYSAGGHFGELALLSGQRRAATVTAEGPTRCLQVSPALCLELPSVVGLLTTITDHVYLDGGILDEDSSDSDSREDNQLESDAERDTDVRVDDTGEKGHCYIRNEAVQPTGTDALVLDGLDGLVDTAAEVDDDTQQFKHTLEDCYALAAAPFHGIGDDIPSARQLLASHGVIRAGWLELQGKSTLVKKRTWSHMWVVLLKVGTPSLVEEPVNSSAHALLLYNSATGTSPDTVLPLMPGSFAAGLPKQRRPGQPHVLRLDLDMAERKPAIKLILACDSSATLQGWQAAFRRIEPVNREAAVVRRQLARLRSIEKHMELANRAKAHLAKTRLSKRIAARNVAMAFLAWKVVSAERRRSAKLAADERFLITELQAKLTEAKDRAMAAEDRATAAESRAAAAAEEGHRLRAVIAGATLSEGGMEENAALRLELDRLARKVAELETAEVARQTVHICSRCGWGERVSMS